MSAFGTGRTCNHSFHIPGKFAVTVNCFLVISAASQSLLPCPAFSERSSGEKLQVLTITYRTNPVRSPGLISLTLSPTAFSGWPQDSSYPSLPFSSAPILRLFQLIFLRILLSLIASWLQTLFRYFFSKAFSSNPVYNSPPPGHFIWSFPLAPALITVISYT